MLAKVLPICFGVIAPQPLKHVAPQVGALVAAAVTQTVTEIVEDMCDTKDRSDVFENTKENV